MPYHSNVWESLTCIEKKWILANAVDTYSPPNTPESAISDKHFLSKRLVREAKKKKKGKIHF